MAAPSPTCPLNLETQIALLTLTSKQHEDDIQEIKADGRGLATLIDQKFDRLHYWMLGILASALGGTVLSLIALLKK